VVQGVEEELVVVVVQAALEPEHPLLLLLEQPIPLL
jgi:hypothetical protein